jgi:hypothetical protein
MFSFLQGIWDQDTLIPKRLPKKWGVCTYMYHLIHFAFEILKIMNIPVGHIKIK